MNGKSNKQRWEIPDEVKQLQVRLQSEPARKEFSRMVEGFRRVFDDDLWPPLPEYLDLAAGLTFSFPTSARLRSQARRHASKVARKIGRRISTNAMFSYEYYDLKQLRKLQTHYRQLADFLKKADRDDLLLGLGNALHYAFWLGQQCPPDEHTAKATEATRGRKPKWYAIADEVMAEQAKKPPGRKLNKTERRDRLHKRLNERLVELGKKAMSPSAVRDYLNDRERT